MTNTERAVFDLGKQTVRELGDHILEEISAAYGSEDTEPEERIKYLLEEVIELYQAEGGSVGGALAVVTRVFARKPGNVYDEATDVTFTFLAYMSARAFNAVTKGHESIAKFKRVRTSPAKHLKNPQ